MHANVFWLVHSFETGGKELGVDVLEDINGRWYSLEGTWPSPSEGHWKSQRHYNQNTC